jgi:serine/threonine protein kinase/Flp pilus assembly protein TadD
MTEPINREVAIFSAALELKGAERAAYLEAACGGDSALLDQVQALLQAHDQAASFMREPAEGVGSKAPLVTNVPPTEKPGERIGHYKLLQQIGEGGCGVVYMAEQEEPVRRRVAFKVIKLGMDTKQVIARFEAERQALALMEHPNIARVIDAGATRTGRPYFVMELVRGVKITDFCDNNKLSTQERLRLFIQVCQAIQHAHQKGVIHRDVKPSNILVTVNDGVAVPKVIDFGIAKATQGRLTDQTLFTAFEQFIGTPAYMSPEQAVMTSLDIDTRSDIYSLGVLLYELLTGRTPFDQKELLAAGLDEMRRTIREKEPPRPSTRLSTMLGDALTTAAKCRQTEAPRLVHLVRGDLDWIVMKCLEKERSRRYETANGLARDIERHLNNEPVLARPPNRLYRFQKSIRRNKTAYTAAALVAGVLVLGVIGSSSQAVRARRAERDQLRQRQIAEKKERKSEQVAQLLKDMLRGVEPSMALGRDSSMLKEILDQSAERVGRDLDDFPEVEAELRSTIGGVYQLIGEYEKAETMQRRGLSLARKLFGNENTMVAQIMNDLALSLTSLDKQTEAESLYLEALAMRRRLLGARDPLVAQTLSNLAFLYRRQGKVSKAEELVREALAIRRERYGNENREVAESLHGLGLVLFREGRLDEAEETLQETLAMRRKMFGDLHPTVADTLQDLGLVYAAQNQQEKAEAALRESLAQERKLLGETHLETTTTTCMLVLTLLAEGKYEPAEILTRQCLTIREKQMPNDARTYSTRSLLGACLLGQKRYVEAEPLLLSGYQGIKERYDKIPWEGQHVLREALDRIIRFYEVTGQSDKVASWKQQIAEVGQTRP